MTRAVLLLLAVAIAGCRGDARRGEEPPKHEHEGRTGSVLEDPFTPLAAKYDAMIALGWASKEDKADILAQEAFFAAHEEEIEKRHRGKWIAIANRRVFAADSLGGAQAAAEKAFPGRQQYLVDLTGNPWHFHP